MQTIPFDNTYARDLEGMYLPFQGAVAPDPALVWLNDALAGDLGLDPDMLRSRAGLAMLTGGAWGCSRRRGRRRPEVILMVLGSPFCPVTGWWGWTWTAWWMATPAR